MSDWISKALESARQSSRAGDRARAESLLREILVRDPSQPDSLHALARLALEAGRDDEAVPLLKRALERKPGSHQAHADLAVALQNLGWNEEALVEAREALALKPGSLSAINTLGNALRALGRVEEAASCFRAAIDQGPGHPALHLNLAAALHDAGFDEQALDAARRAATLAPENAAAHLMVGTLERARGHHDEAARSLGRALEIQPESADAHDELGNLYVDLGVPVAAEASYRRALAAEPAHAGALYHLGDLLRSAGRLDEAKQSYAAAAAARPDWVAPRLRLGQLAAERSDHVEAAEHFGRAIVLAPAQAEAHAGLGSAARALGRLDEAAAAYGRAVRIREDFAEAWCNLSTVHLDGGRLDEAIDCARRAIAVEPDLAEAHWNLGQAFLARGDFERGWPEYEYRLRKRNAAELSLPYPVWDGSPLAGRTLLVTAEQGVGDEVMFASCISDALAEDGPVILEADPRLVPLFARSFPEARVVSRLDSADGYPIELPEPDVRIAIGSLPLRYRPDPESFRRAPFLIADPATVEHWRARLRDLGEGMMVGISWRGGKEALARRARSIPLAQWPLGKRAGLHLVDLQYGETAEERREAAGAGLVLHHFEDSDPLVDLDGFAALIASLDLVVSVDNANVHLAGALGVPTWVLLPAAADWRWMTGREDAYWYPSLRLFRQRRPGEWGEAFERVVGAIEVRLARDASR